MAEIKWIKLSVNMFDDEKIKLIRTMPEGDTILMVFIMLLMEIDDPAKRTVEYNLYTFERFEKFGIDSKQLMEAVGALMVLGIVVINKADELQFIDFDRFASFDRECIIKNGNRKDLRHYVLERDGYKCVYCGDLNGPFEADHVYPQSKGGLDIEENLVCACMRCNRSKKDKTLKEWRGLI